MTIADAYEAMTSSRPYRKIPLTHEQAVEQLEKFAGIQFDPEIVPVLVEPGPQHPGPAAGSAGRAADHAPSAGPARPDPARPRGSCREPPRTRSEAPWPRTMFLSTIVLALIVGALAGGGLPRTR